MISVGKKKLVRSVPTELNKDHNQILELAQVTSILYHCLPFLIFLSAVCFCFELSAIYILIN